MNCDEAFDRITDPERCRSAELDWHLEMCPRCRQMREVLAPALDLLAPQEAEFAVGEDVGFSPGDNDCESRREAFLSPESLAVAERAARDLSPQRRPRRSQRRGMGLLRYAAAFAFGAMLAVGGFLFVESPKTSRAAGLPATNSCLLMQQPASTDSLRQAGADSVIQQCRVCHAGERK